MQTAINPGTKLKKSNIMSNLIKLFCQMCAPYCENSLTLKSSLHQRMKDSMEFMYKINNTKKEYM